MILTLAALSVTATLGQNPGLDITGTWQGTFQSGGSNQQRIVVKISRTGSGELKAVLYNLDRGAVPLAANSVAVQASTIRMSFNAFNGGYEGKWNADKNTMTGAFNIGGNSFPLAMTRATDATAWTIPEPPARLPRMRPDASPAFEVATIKPTDPNDRSGQGFHSNGRHIYTTWTSVGAIIMVAYGVHPRQIIGGPDWMNTAMYNVSGQPDEPGQPSFDQQRIMYQKLLAERFQFAFHREKKELPVYLLTVAKNGPQLAKHEASSTSLDQTMHGRGYLTETYASMTDFAAMLQASIFDRPVLDQTGLEGRFDFTLKWTPDEFERGVGRTPQNDSPDAPPNIFTAIQQQLGLKLEAAKAPCDVLVIDKLEKPSEN